MISLFFLFIGDVIKDREQDENLLFVDRFITTCNQVFPDAENDSSQFPSNRDGIFGVVFLVVIGGSLKDVFPVNSSWFDGSANMDNESAIHSFILEVGNWWNFFLDHRVSPFT